MMGRKRSARRPALDSLRAHVLVFRVVGHDGARVEVDADEVERHLDDGSPSAPRNARSSTGYQSFLSHAGTCIFFHKGLIITGETLDIAENSTILGFICRHKYLEGSRHKYLEGSRHKCLEGAALRFIDRPELERDSRRPGSAIGDHHPRQRSKGNGIEETLVDNMAKRRRARRCGK